MLRPVGEVVVEGVDASLGAIDELVDHHEVAGTQTGLQRPGRERSEHAAHAERRHRREVGAVVDPVRGPLVVPTVPRDERHPQAGHRGDGHGRRRLPVAGRDGHLGGVGEERVEPGTSEDPRRRRAAVLWCSRPCPDVRTGPERRMTTRAYPAVKFDGAQLRRHRMSTHRPMEGIRILDLADHTFVPAASAILSDWGAEVIKVEHITRGDAARGLASSGLAMFGGEVSPILEHANRGKLSLALDLNQDEGRDILYRLAAISDVFLTNKMPSVREKLKTDIDDIRVANPNIIYVSGHGYGATAGRPCQKSDFTLAQLKKLGCTTWLASPARTKAPGAVSVLSASASRAGVRSCTSSMAMKSYRGVTLAAHSWATRFGSSARLLQPFPVAAVKLVENSALLGIEQRLADAEGEVGFPRQGAAGFGGDDAAQLFKAAVRVGEAYDLEFAYLTGITERDRGFLHSPKSCYPLTACAAR